MSLVVYKNLSAMNAHRYLKMNENSFSKSVERLSSGLRINRAADDPAGLVISEQFRSQVEGLNQAIRNANDGVSLVQTAESALDETTTVLRTMRNLALHAANTGASDQAAILADQEQVDASIETLNRIANTTAFGTRKLLNGSSGVTGTSDQSSITFIEGSVNTVGGSYAVDNLIASAKGTHMGGARLEINGVGSGGVTNAAGTINADSSLTFTGAAIGGKTITANFSAGDNAAAVQTAIEEAFAAEGYTVTASATLAAAAGGDVEITGLSQMGADDASSLAMTGTGDYAVMAANTRTTAAADNDTKLSKAETLTIKDGSGAFVSVALNAGDTVGSAVSRINSALDDAGFTVNAKFDAGTSKFVLENEEYGDKTVVKYTASSSLADGTTASGTGLALGAAGADQYIADGGGGGTAGANVTGKIGGFTAVSTDGVYLQGATGTDVEGIKIKIEGGSTTSGNISVEQNSLQFQVGAFSNQTVKVALGDMRTTQLGNTATGTTYMSTVNVANIDLTTADGAQDAIKVIDAALDEVSSMRSKMGSFQKDILESSVRNLGVAAQNMAASESVIRDADMAQEMLNFSKSQILQSTGMAMLAQANQAPQSIMRLFG